MSQPELKRAMGLWDLVLFNLTAVVSIRWFATAGRTGPSSLTLWMLAALLFFIPQGIAVYYLSTLYPEEGGIYRWTRRAFGDFHGFFCGWCYWVSNLVFFPALLMFAAGAAAYIGGPSYVWLGGRGWFSFSVALVLLWVAIIANVVGLNVGKWVQNVGGLATWLPAMLLVVFGAVSYWKSGSANAFSARAMTPSWDLGTLSFWSTIAFAFAGLELGPIMSGEIRDPRRHIPRALVISGALIALVYLAGTWAVLVVLPVSKVDVVTGTLQTIDEVARRAGFGSVAQLMGLLLPLSTLGGTGAWLAGSARIPFVAGIDRFLPPAFARVHPRWHTPHVAILTQGVLASLFLVLGFPGSTVADTYLLLSELSIIVYFIPYLYLFLCAMQANRTVAEAVALPGGRLNIWLGSITGFGVTLLAIVVSLIPSSAVTNPWLYEAKLVGGSVLFFAVGLVLYSRRRV